MKLIIDKIKYFLNIILNYLKSILTAIFGGILNIFSNDNNNNNKELKSIKLDQENKNIKKDINSGDFSGFRNENPETIVLNKDITFSVSIENLEKLIQKRFCQELEIEDKDLTKNEKDYLKDINAKIIPVINKNIEVKYITNENVLDEEIKKLVKKELENQFKLEQSNELPTDKIIIIPILVNKREKISKPVTNSEPTFLESKIKELVCDDSQELIDDSLTISNEDIPPIDDKTSDVDNNIPINNSNDIESISESFESENRIGILDTNINNNFDESSEENTLNSDIKKIDGLENKTESLEDNVESLEDNSTSIDSSRSSNLIPPSVHIQIMEETLEDLNEPLKIKTNENMQKQENLETYDFKNLDSLIEKVIYTYNTEVKKEEFEDKNYDLIENLIQDLLNKVEKLKLKNLDPLSKEKLIAREKDILTLRDNLFNQKQRDISIEKDILDEVIPTNDLKNLDLELQKMHLDEKIELQEYMIQSLEDLNALNGEKANLIEKELLKIKLKKAIHVLEIPSLLALPFIRNKYFMIFTGGLFVNHHLKFFDAILKRKSLQFDPEDLTQVKTGSDAFLDALLISKQNIDYLETLEMEALKKHPELMLDADFIIQINQLKTKLLQQQEKLLKKEAMIKKNNLRLNKRIRKLKKKENQKI